MLLTVLLGVTVNPPVHICHDAPRHEALPGMTTHPTFSSYTFTSFILNLQSTLMPTAFPGSKGT
jgi:hypothetical protein